MLQRALIILGIISSIAITGLYAEETDVGDFFDSFLLTEDSEDWMVKIEDVTLNSNLFMIGYETYLSELTEEEQLYIAEDEDAFKEMYYDFFVNQYIILMKALEDELFEQSEMEAYLRAVLLQAVYQAYFQYEIGDDYSQFEPTDEEVEAFYTENVSLFLESGMSSSQIREYITYQLAQLNMQAWMEERIDRAKESYRIQRNEDMLEAMGLD